MCDVMRAIGDRWRCGASPRVERRTVGGEGGDGVLVTAWSTLVLRPDLESVPEPDVGSAGDTAR